MAKIRYRKQMEIVTSVPEFVQHKTIQEQHKYAVRAAIEGLEETGNVEEGTKKNVHFVLNQILSRILDINDKKKTPGPVIGIDFGTTMCCVATCLDPNNPYVIINEMGNNKTPSYVAFSNYETHDDDLEIECGEPAKLKAHGNSKGAIFDVKRMLGQTYNDVEGIKKYWPFDLSNDHGEIQLRPLCNMDKSYTPVEVAIILLSHLQELAETDLDTKVVNVVVAVPVDFNVHQRELVKDACELAGLNLLKLVHEPTAAAFAYIHHQIKSPESKKNYIIIDFGGGTLDIAVVTILNHEIEIKAVVGNSQLGGNNIDHIVVEYCLQQFEEQRRINLRSCLRSSDRQTVDEVAKYLQQLQILCEINKRTLSTKTRTAIVMERIYGKKSLTVKLSREEFESLNKDIFEACISLIQEALEKSKQSTADIDDFVLVGGSSRIPMLKKMISDFFGKQASQSVNVDEAVAIGAALLAFADTSPSLNESTTFKSLHAHPNADAENNTNTDACRAVTKNEVKDRFSIMEANVRNILETTNDDIKLDMKEFNKVLDKVGDSPVVIYSISGVARSGKSYLLSHFIKYFEAQKQNPRQNFGINSGPDQNWINFPLTSSFVWRSGKERETTGIHIWSEPYFVTRGNEKVAVLLMDTPGLFDDKTTAWQNAIIFSLTTLCSSVTIFNVMRQVDEDLLQQIQFFSSYAQMVSSDSVVAQHVIHDRPSLVSMTCSDGSEDAPFQNMILVVRDFEVPGYSHGLHRRGRQPEENSKNFLLDTFYIGRNPENYSYEKEMMRTGILQKYQDVSAYLLPDPGKKFKAQAAEPNDDFQEHLKEFIEHLVSTKHLVGKIVDGRPCTGTEFKAFVSKLSSIFEKSKETCPKVYTMAENTAFIQYTIAKDTSFKCYKDKMNTFISDHEKNDLNQKFFHDFKIAHTEALKSAIEIYKRLRKFKNPKFDKQFEKSISEDIMEHFDTTYEILKHKGNLEDYSLGGGYVDTMNGDVLYVDDEHWLNYYLTVVKDWIVRSLFRLTSIWVEDSETL